jgi:hypothetical protein
MKNDNKNEDWGIKEILLITLLILGAIYLAYKIISGNIMMFKEMILNSFPIEGYFLMGGAMIFVLLFVFLNENNHQ